MLGKNVHKVTDYFGQTIGLFSSEQAALDCVAATDNFGFEYVGVITVALREISRDHYMARSTRTQIAEFDEAADGFGLHIADAMTFMNSDDLASAYRPEFDIHGHGFANNLWEVAA